MSEQSQQKEQRAADKQQSNNGEERSNKRRSSNILDNELLDPSCLSFPPPDHDDHLLVENFDATNAFHKLQLSICQHKWKLSLENHIHYAMAATSILLLSRNQYSEELSPYFNEDGLKATIDSIEAMYGIKKPQISMETVTSMISIIEDLTIGAISRDKAIVRLLDLEPPANENKFKKGIIELVSKLPRVSIVEDMNEYELGTRYIDPFLCGLFDDPDEGILYLR
ncbi:hypothetical protein DFQ28_005262 [Apophysomyces sp. BC1034]|nr:hypothetical protein DFQ28_005262 [Apophysomyces sp. BC1034]